ncbi:MAG: hypothetical protein V4631_03185 [Pseudomonadota bacterium]
MEAKKPAAPVKPGPPAKPKVVIEAYSFRKNGLPHIRKAATIFAISLLLSAALVTAGRLVLLQARPATAASQEKQIAARNRLNGAQIERIEIRDFQPKFEQLRARGFVGNENRLAMVEAIQAIQKAHRLLPVTFSFSPQQLVAVDPLLLAAPLELHSTSVSLKMDLLHEMDLINFFQDLKARGFFSVKECLLNNLGEVTAGTLSPRVSAECTLYWLSIGEAAPVVDPNAPPPAG